MPRTYNAVLSGDHVEWIDTPPDRSRPLAVRITVLHDGAGLSARERGQRMAEALKAIARRGGVSAIADPIEWQREIRRERALLGRDS
jgi:hypothetical protein